VNSSAQVTTDLFADEIRLAGRAQGRRWTVIICSREMTAAVVSEGTRSPGVPSLRPALRVRSA
jgi:hypothetical protein